MFISTPYILQLHYISSQHYTQLDISIWENVNYSVSQLLIPDNFTNTTNGNWSMPENYY